MPANAIYVGRPTKWGNPFPTDGEMAAFRAVALGFRGDAAGRHAGAVEAYRQWLVTTGTRLEFQRDPRLGGIPVRVTVFIDQRRPSIDEIQLELRGLDLCCWCRLDQPCHADVLLEIANR